MIRHSDLDPADLRGRIRRGEITLGGYDRMRIYGRLDCASGKRMLRQHRVFFRDEAEALAAGYRPCGNCLRPQYRVWKAQQEAPARRAADRPCDTAGEPTACRPS